VRILVVIRAPCANRQSEGLRAGLGLGLRGDEVQVVVPDAIDLRQDPRIDRALATLAQLGRPARLAVGEEDLTDLIERADAVEMWGPAVPTHRRSLRTGGPDRRLIDELDNSQLIREILEAHGASLD